MRRTADGPGREPGLQPSTSNGLAAGPNGSTIPFVASLTGRSTGGARLPGGAAPDDPFSCGPDLDVKLLATAWDLAWEKATRNSFGDINDG
jgi:hypothetical protein